MKMIRNMAFCYGGKFYATQGGPLRLGYSISEGQVPADWDTEIVTNYPQRITKDTLQFTLIDSDACGITGLLSDFDPDDADARCAKVLKLYAVVGDENSGAGCDPTGANMGTLFVRSASAYVTNVAPSSVTIDGERVETLAVTFRTTTPFVLENPIVNLSISAYASAYGATEVEETAGALSVQYGVAMPELLVADLAAGALAGHTFDGLADCQGKLYYLPPTEAAPTKYVAAVAKFDRLLPIKLYYKFTATES